jgi:integrase
MAAPKVSLRKIKRKNGIVYALDFRVKGKRIREMVGSNKSDAELVRSTRQSELLLGNYNIANAKNSSVGLTALVEEYLKDKKNHIRPSSLKRYKNYLERFVWYFKSFFPGPAADISLIEPKYIKEFIDHAIENKDENGKQWTKATTNDAIQGVKAAFDYAVKNKYLSSNPFDDIKKFKETNSRKLDIFTKDELERIWQIVDPHWIGALKFIANTGLRKGELINLKWTSVDLTPGKEQITIESNDEWETKSGKFRTVPLNEEAARIIKEQRGRNAEIVFTSKEGKQIHPDKIYHAFKNALEKLGLEGDVHKLRHQFGSDLVNAGVPLMDVKELLGHSELKTTLIYTHVAPKNLRDAVAKLGTGEKQGSETAAAS